MRALWLLLVTVRCIQALQFGGAQEEVLPAGGEENLPNGAKCSSSHVVRSPFSGILRAKPQRQVASEWGIWLMWLVWRAGVLGRE